MGPEGLPDEPVLGASPLPAQAGGGRKPAPLDVVLWLSMRRRLPQKRPRMPKFHIEPYTVYICTRLGMLE